MSKDNYYKEVMNMGPMKKVSATLSKFKRPSMGSGAGTSPGKIKSMGAGSGMNYSKGISKPIAMPKAPMYKNYLKGAQSAAKGNRPRAAQRRLNKSVGL